MIAMVYLMQYIAYPPVVSGSQMFCLYEYNYMQSGFGCERECVHV